MPRIGIVDYGMGNLHSVAQAFVKEGAETGFISAPGEFASWDAIILPGVGHFGEAMARLVERGLVDPVRKAALSGLPFFGICLGLQLLFDSSEEAPGVAGLGVFPGTVRRFPETVEGKQLIVPAIGWNRVTRREKNALLPDSEYFYFVHSYYVDPQGGVSDGIVAGTADYGVTYTAAVERAGLFATQFHPEKSATAGLQIIRKFLAGVRPSHYHIFSTG